MLLGLCLALYYVLAYRPLSVRVAAIEAPLRQLSQELLAISPQTNAFGREYLDRVAELRRQVNSSGAALTQMVSVVRARIAFDATTRDRIEQPFRLIDFENERQTRLDELRRMAREQKVSLEPGVASGFPEYAVDRKYPTLLWPELSIAHHLVTAAIQCQLGRVVQVQVLPFQVYPGSTNASRVLFELPVRLEVVGSGGAAGRFLELLPLTAPEAQARGYPEPAKDKPVLFLQRILLRKEAKERLEEVRLELTASAFVWLDRYWLE